MLNMYASDVFAVPFPDGATEYFMWTLRTGGQFWERLPEGVRSMMPLLKRLAIKVERNIVLNGYVKDGDVSVVFASKTDTLTSYWKAAEFAGEIRALLREEGVPCGGDVAYIECEKREAEKTFSRFALFQKDQDNRRIQAYPALRWLQTVDVPRKETGEAVFQR